MLTRDTQDRLLARYGGTTRERSLRKAAFDRKLLVEGFQAEFNGERPAPAAIIFVDIAGFSGMVDGKTATQVRSILDTYYSAALPIINECGGQIDRIIGDGIVAVFSTFFCKFASIEEAEDAALGAAERIVALLHKSPIAAKSSLSTGELLFCKTGLADVYEDYTVIGTPLTELYRIEETTELNQVRLRSDSPLGKRLWQTVKVPGERGLNRQLPWLVEFKEEVLRGVDGDIPVELFIESYRG